MQTRKAVTIANSIRLRRQLHSGAFLVVEGHSDRLFFEKFVHPKHCIVTAAGGRVPVAEVVDILVAAGFEGILGVVDGDAVRVGVVRNENLFLLEDPDLEVMLIQSTALDGVLVEFGSNRKLGRLAEDVCDLLIRAARPIGCFRIHSLTAGLGLTFDGIKYVRFVDVQSLELDRHALVEEVKRRSQKSALDCAPILEAITLAESTMADTWVTCCGDDVVSVLGLGLRRLFGTNNAGAVSYDVLVRSLRLAYSDSEFKDSRVCQDLLDWTNRNQGFSVLATA